MNIKKSIAAMALAAFIPLVTPVAQAEPAKAVEMVVTAAFVSDKGGHKYPEGKAILAKGLVQRFDPPNDKNYDDIRKYEQQAKDAGFVDHN